ncbi:unnamed protein product [Cylindrotheca closterium]|uniref:H(+)-exporting diphosphatase n=1 Tax=Cylindrotheca closterium TaxID=2856 RepID=A0AAD2FWB4_9STRA|nr:unnamed protein product [Cylindrotheca closterium]
MRVFQLATLFLVSTTPTAFSFVPQSARTLTDVSLSAKNNKLSQYDPFHLDHHETTLLEPNMKIGDSAETKALALGALAMIGTPASASAATAFTATAIPGALAAYGHYASLLGMLACVMIERLTIKPNMSEREEDFLAAADIAFGFWGLLITYTGYLRATAYEKGFDFYSHEPLFWLKICFLGIFGASSFFNTTIIVKRSIAKRNGEFEPMSEALAQRMIKICNAELFAIGIIPLTATFMARGVLYSDSIPWQAEAGLSAAVFVGLSYKYLNEAFTFED